MMFYEVVRITNNYLSMLIILYCDLSTCTCTKSCNFCLSPPSRFVFLPPSLPGGWSTWSVQHPPPLSAHSLHSLQWPTGTQPSPSGQSLCTHSQVTPANSHVICVIVIACLRGQYRNYCTRPWAMGGYMYVAAVH